MPFLFSVELGRYGVGVTPDRDAFADRSVIAAVVVQAASYMRAVLKTLAQCHSHNILHRDVKPGNFMLASDIEDAHVKAIDFGLAVPYGTPEDVDNIDMQGTPWFLAPEVLASKWSPKADTWAAVRLTTQFIRSLPARGQVTDVLPFHTWPQFVCVR